MAFCRCSVMYKFRIPGPHLNPECPLYDANDPRLVKSAATEPLARPTHARKEA